MHLLHPLTLHEDPGPFSNIKGLTYYKDNEEDPYITLKDVRTQMIGFYEEIHMIIVGSGGRKGRTGDLPY